MSISAEDILRVAKSINFEPTEKEVEEVQLRYTSEEEEDFGATWDLIVEKILYDLKSERNLEEPKSYEKVKEEIINKKQKLIDAVLEEIKKDVTYGDLTAIEELLKFCPTKNLISYLPEETGEKFN